MHHKFDVNLHELSTAVFDSTDLVLLVWCINPCDGPCLAQLCGLPALCHVPLTDEGQVSGPSCSGLQAAHLSPVILLLNWVTIFPLCPLPGFVSLSFVRGGSWVGDSFLFVPMYDY